MYITYTYVRNLQKHVVVHKQMLDICEFQLQQTFQSRCQYACQYRSNPSGFDICHVSSWSWACAIDAITVVVTGEMSENVRTHTLVQNCLIELWSLNASHEQKNKHQDDMMNIYIYIILYYNIILYYIISFHIISCHVLSYHIILYYIMLYYIILYYIYRLVKSQEKLTVWTNSDEIYVPLQLGLKCVQGRDYIYDHICIRMCIYIYMIYVHRIGS